MIISLEEAKTYLRLDESHEDLEIVALISAAETYLTNAGAVLSEGNELAKLAVKLLVVHWYEHRGAVLTGSISKSLEYSLQSIIAQLRYCYDTITI